MFAPLFAGRRHIDLFCTAKILKKNDKTGIYTIFNRFFNYYKHIGKSTCKTLYINILRI